MGIAGISALSAVIIMASFCWLLVCGGQETSFFDDFDHRSGLREVPADG